METEITGWAVGAPKRIRIGVKIKKKSWADRTKKRKLFAICNRKGHKVSKLGDGGCVCKC